MRALNLDFKYRPPRFPLAGVSLLLLGALVLGVVWGKAHELSGRIELAQMRLQNTAQRGRMPAPQPADPQAFAEEVQQANDILQQLTLPWDALFKVVETSNDKEIALLSIQPDAGKRQLRIEGESRNLGALLAYIERLEQSRVLTRVFLTSHEVRTQDPERPVRFALAASWVVQP